MTDRVDSQQAEDVAHVIVSEWPFYAREEDRVPAIAAILARLVREGQIRELGTVREGIALAAIGGAPYPSIIAALDARIAALKGEG